MLESIKPIDPNDFFLSRGKKDLRIRDLINSADADPPDFSILGYPDDEGIRLNSGRPGAVLGPEGIRNFFYRMTPPWFLEQYPSIGDFGNLDQKLELTQKHKIGLSNCHELLKTGSKIIGLGGGHDFAYPDGAAFLKEFSEEKPLIINFDAHLDVRNLDKGYNSGTPFFRLLTEFDNFDLIEVGIQAQCNSQSHAHWALAKGAHILSYEQISSSAESLSSLILQEYSSLLTKQRKAYISVDIDAFSSAYAPGCSQSWPTGLNPDDFFQCFHYLKQILDVRLLGIYEVSPPLDTDFKTQRLASQIMYNYIFDLQ